MESLNTYPIDDGFYMPAEFSPHWASIVIWPERAGSWGKNPYNSRCAFAKVITELSNVEKVFVAVGKSGVESAKQMLSANINIIPLETDDSWARDIAPTFVKNSKDEIRGIDWNFNAWGGNFDGSYQSYINDNAFAKKICDAINVSCYDAQHFVLEGGAIHSDGEGTVIVTEACLLSKGRNPNLSKYEIEENLKKYLGAKKIIWLPNGIYNDETNEHIDNVCAFIKPAEVVLAWTDNKNDSQYKMSKEDYDVLLTETDAKGRHFTVHKLPIPKYPVCIHQEDISNFEFEEGEYVREVGERLAASYVNFYFANGIILLPAFGGENSASDKLAEKILKNVCPNHRIIPINATNIIKGGGNIHCITQQIPSKKG